jgi:hypothetical protein
MVAPLTEVISCAALKRQRNTKTATHAGMVLIAQRSQIACHGSNAIPAPRAMSLLKRNDSVSMSRNNARVRIPNAPQAQLVANATR